MHKETRIISLSNNTSMIAGLAVIVKQQPPDGDVRVTETLKKCFDIIEHKFF